jgi:type IV secretory pathway VirB10-like protein
MYRGLSARALALGILACGLTACSGSADKNGTNGGAAGRAALIADSTARVVSAARTIAAGTAIEATIQDPVSSRTNSAGQQVKAIVSRNVLDAGGGIAIPGGASILLGIAVLRPAKGTSATDGSIALTMTSVVVRDTAYALSARVGSVPHTLAPIAGTTGDRDVVVTPGTPITITLTQPLKIFTK